MDDDIIINMKNNQMQHLNDKNVDDMLSLTQLYLEKGYLMQAVMTLEISVGQTSARVVAEEWIKEVKRRIMIEQIHKFLIARAIELTVSLET